MSHHTHIFRSQRQPTPKELHCLWAHLTDKQHTDKPGLLFKVHANGRLIHVTSELPVPVQAVTLDTNTFDFLRTVVPAPAPALRAGQFVTLSGELAYSVHSTRTGKDVCPVDGRGQLKSEQAKAFLAYLTRTLGVDCEQAHANKAITFTREDRSEPQDKVWLNDVISVFVTAAVVDPAAVARLGVAAVGRRKSYGLGHFQIAEVAEMAE